MQGFNHVAGGLAFTGIFASFTDVNVFERPEYIAVTVFGSLLADVDHTKSPIGKAFYPLAKWIDRKYGHRTVTHSFLFFAAIAASFGIAEFLILGTRTHTLLFTLAYGSHLLFDMCTRQGIPLFLPFSRARCVLPANPKLRLSSQNFTSEIVVFFCFVGLLLSTMPLMANGFWTSYNKAFATFSHLQRENSGSADILYITTKQGISGDVVASKGEETILFTSGAFQRLEHSKYTLDKFSHTGKPKQSHSIEFESIGIDSMQSILKLPILSLRSVSTLPIRYKIAGEQYEKASLDLSYTSGFSFIPVLPDSTAQLERIASIHAGIAEKETMLSNWHKEQASKRVELANLQHSYTYLTEYEQGKAIDQIAKLRAELESARAPELAIPIQAAKDEIKRIRATIGEKKHLFTGIVEVWKP